MHQFEEQESQPLRRQAHLDEYTVELHARADLMDRYNRRTQMWSMLFNFALQFTVIRMMSPTAPWWVFAPLMAITLGFFALFHYDVFRRIPTVRRAMQRQSDQLARCVIRVDPIGVRTIVHEKVRQAVRWSEVERVSVRGGWMPGVILHLHNGKRVAISSFGYTETPDVLAEIIDAGRQRWG